MYLKKNYKIAISSIIVILCLLCLIGCKNKKEYDMSNISFNDFTTIYDGEEHELLIDGELPDGVSVSYSKNKLTNAGELLVTATFTGNKKYEEIPSMEAKLTILPISLEITVNDSSSIYGDNIIDNGYKITKGSIVDADVEKLNIHTYVDENIVNSSSHYGVYENAIKVLYNDNQNYDITIIDGTYKIEKDVINLSNVSFKDSEVTYDGKSHMINVSNLPKNVTVEYYVDNKKFTGATNAGTYKVKAVFTASTENYEVNVESIEATLKINKRDVEIKVCDSSSYRGEELVTNGYEISKGSFANNNDLKSLNLEVYVDDSVMNQYSIVGTYNNALKLKYNTNNNYNIKVTNGTYILEQKYIDLSDVAFKDIEVTYDGNLHTIEVPGLPSDVNVIYKLNETTFDGAINSGSYYITAYFSTSNEYYKVSIDKLSATLTINKRDVTVSANDSSSVYKDEIKDSGYIVSNGSILESDLEGFNFKVSVLELSNNSNVGIYEDKITINYTENTNYNITIINGDYTITSLTLDLSNVSLQNKEITYNGEIHNLEFINLPEGISIEYKVDDSLFEGAKNVGVYNVTAYLTSVDENILLNKDTFTGVLTINVQEVTFTANDSSSVYKEEIKDSGYTVTSGSIVKDDLDDLNIKVNVLELTNESLVGVYEDKITITYSENVNYKITIINGDYTISKADFSSLNIEFKDKSFTYDGLEHELLLTTELSSDFNVVYSNNKQTKAGEYTVEVVITNSNYNDSLILTAKLIIIKDGTYHDVVFNMNDGSTKLLVIKNGEYITNIPEIPTKDGYTASWDYDFTKPILKDETIVISYEIITYNINYVIGDYKNNENNVIEYNVLSETVVLYPLNTDLGCTFVSWHTSSTLSDDSAIYSILAGSTGDITLYPKLIEYNIESAPGFTFNYEDYELPAITMTVANSKTLITLSSAINVSNGCSWTLSKDIEGAELIKTKNMSLEIGHNLAYVTIWYEDLYNLVYLLDIYRLDIKSYQFYVEEQEYLSDTIEEGSLLSKPINPLKEGYTFKGWRNNITQEIASFPYQVNADASFTAVFEQNEYLLTYDVNGGDEFKINNFNIKYDSNISLDTPTRKGYSFDGWELSLNNEIIETGVTSFHNNYIGNINAKALWKANDYTITYVANGGTIEKTTQEVTYDTEVELYSIVKTGYTFKGYYYNDELFESGIYTVTSDITLEAIFEANKYTITYDVNGGEEFDSLTQDVVYDSDFSLTIPSRIGYKFEGYTYDSGIKLENGIYKISKNITVKANWSIINYSIFYILDDSTNSYENPSTYNIESNVILENPTKKGYKFEGWYLEQSYITKISSIEKGSINDITIYAKFTINTYRVNYYIGDELYDSQEIVYKENLTLLPSFSKDELELVKWSTTEKEYNPSEIIKYEFDYDLNFTAIIASVSSEFTANIINEEALITSYTGTNSNVLIPEYFKQEDKYYEVIGIGSSAFYGCSSLTSITIPDNVTSIGDRAFSGCSSLTSITIPEGVTSIGDYAFLSCSSLTIYCEVTSQPSGWHSRWNYSNRPVYWGIKILENNEIKYFLDLKTDTAIISRYLGSDSEINISESIEYNSKIYNVTSIGDSAFSGCSNITSITIPEVVTSIGDSAFSGCSNIRSITIPEGVTSIGDSVFSGCSNIRSITIPEGVTSIGDSAFSGCNNIRSITIPEGVTSIGDYAFSGCSNIRSITIPEGVISIGSCAFSGCSSLVSITLPFVGDTVSGINNTQFGYIFGEESYYQDSVPTSLKEVIITGGTSIGSSAFFYCRNIRSIIIPDNVTSIGDSAFYGCSSLTSITIPEGVTSIGSSAFSGCSNLTSITIPDSVTSIGSSAFSYCYSLTIYCEVSSKPSGWSSSWNSSRPVCWGINESNFVEINGIEYVLDLENNTATISRYVGDDTEIEISANIEYNSKTYNVKSIGDYAFYECSSLTSITIPDSVTSIGNYAFSYCSSLTSITIPEGVTSIGDYAFSSCSSLTIYCEVTSEPSGWSSSWNSSRPVYWGINESNFVEINGIKYVLDLDNNIATLSRYVGEDTEIEISANIEYNSKTYNVTSIGGYAFRGCSSLTSITIPEGVTSIGDYAFYKCSSLTIYCEVTSEPSGWYSKWNYDNRPVYWGINESNFVEINEIEYVLDLENNTATISRYVRDDTEIEISANIEYNSKTYNVTSIGAYVFSNCSSLTSITIPEGVTSIGAYAFSGCSSLTSITIPEGVTSIGASAFSYCYSLTIYCEVSSKPSGWSSEWNSSRPVYWGINESNFVEINGIEYVLGLENNRATISRYVGDDTEIEISANIEYNSKTYNVKIIGDYAFSYCSSLTSITIPDSVTSIGDYAFLSCNSLTIYCEVSSKPSGWSSSWNRSRPVYWGINESNFVEINGIEYVLDLENNTATISRYVGEDTEIEISANIEYNSKTINVTSIGAYAFSGCSSLTSVTIPEGVTSIGDDAFLSCSSLTIYCEVTSQPSGWHSDWNYYNSNYSNRPVYWGINESNFVEINGIEYVLDLENNTATISRYVGEDTEIEISANIEYNSKTINVTSIGAYAFSNCSSLTSITIPEGVTSIGAYAFLSCSSLTIYCEVTSEPLGWYSKWNYDNRPVYWNYKTN